MAGIYHGHIVEFPQIRIDCFTPHHPQWSLPHPTHPSAPPIPAPNAQLFLLTHVHSDHLTGLTNNFTGKIICSPDTKRMLPWLQTERERQLKEEGFRETATGVRTYKGLGRKVIKKGTKDERTVDLIEAVPYNDPREYEIGYQDGKPIIVKITLIDANHCPGSAMFLIESEDKAVLHTGDIRVDRPHLQALRNNPALGQYIEPWPMVPSCSDLKPSCGRRALDRIYLDTGAMLGTGDMPDRDDVLKDLIGQMSLYPDDTIFFLNVWCLGWESVVKEVARHFGQPVYVDRYKQSVYAAVKNDPFLLACTTSDENSTRFHACERKHRCKACKRWEGKQPVYNLDKRIVQVNMVEVKTAEWIVQNNTFKAALGKAAVGEGHWPHAIDCPIARHSVLPELQSFVNLFKPKALTPNTVWDAALGCDYFILPDLFSHCVRPEALESIIRERDEYLENRYSAEYLQYLYGEQAHGRDVSAKFRQEWPGPPGTEPQVKKENIPLHQGRHASGQDQLARAGGFTPRTVSHQIRLVSMGGGTAEERAAKARTFAGYDTDEESPNRKRRRGDHGDFEESEIEIKKEVKEEMVVKRESPPNSFQRRLPRLDKDHIQALMKRDMGKLQMVGE